MSFRFRKSFKIAPGIRFNLGKKSGSFTIGKRGSSFSIGSRGTYANLGIKGTGLSYRAKISGLSQKKTKKMARASKINQLEKLESMYRKGQISQHEYAQLKYELMNEHIMSAEPARRKSGCLGFFIKLFFVAIIMFIVFIFVIANDSNSNNLQKKQHIETQKTQDNKKQQLDEAESGKKNKPLSEKERKQIENLF